MQTVPTPELSPREVTWIVRPSAFPFSVSRETIGVVRAPDKRAAEDLAAHLYGRDVVVERATEKANG